MEEENVYHSLDRLFEESRSIEKFGLLTDSKRYIYINNNPFGGKKGSTGKSQFLFLILRVVWFKKYLCTESENCSNWPKKISYVP